MNLVKTQALTDETKNKRHKEGKKYGYKEILDKLELSD